METEYKFEPSDVTLELDPSCDAAVMRRIAKEIFDTAHPSKGLFTDGDMLYGRLRHRLEGKSGTAVYQLDFLREPPNLECEQQDVYERYIIRVHQGEDAEKQYKREYANIQKLKSRGSDLLSCTLLKGFSEKHILVIRHAEDEAGRLRYLHEVIRSSVREPYQLASLQDSLQEFMKRLSQLYNSLGDKKSKEATKYFDFQVRHRLPPDLFLDASQATQQEIEWKDSTLILHGGSVAAGIDLGFTKPLDPQKLMEHLQRGDSSETFRGGINLEVTESLLPGSTPSILKLRCGQVRLWIYAKKESLEKLSGKAIKKIAFRDFANLKLGSQQLALIGFPSEACLSRQEFRTLCMQIGELTLRYRHTDLHSENVLASHLRQKVIDIGAAWYGLAAVDSARLEADLWLRIGAAMGVAADETLPILGALEQHMKVIPADLSEPAQQFYLVLHALRSGACSEPNKGVSPEQEALAYVQEALIFQRYQLEKFPQAGSPLFAKFAAYWIARLRKLVGASVNAASPPAPEVPSVERAVATSSPGPTPSFSAAATARPQDSTKEQESAAQPVVESDKAACTTLGTLWRAALEPVDAPSREFLGCIEQQDGTLVQKELTDLQQELYRQHLAGATVSPFTSEQHVIIAAPTSSGKSTVAEMFLARAAFKYGQCALYIAPTRALAQAKYRDLCKLLAASGRSKSIVLSTADDTKDDWKLSHGKFAIACLVYEKANILFSRNQTLLGRVGCLVIDEIHMLADLDRGPILEMVLSKAVRHRNQAADRTGPAQAPLLKIVAISTESALDDGFLNFLSIRRAKPLPPHKPLVVRASGRPQALDHYLLLRGNDESAYTPFFLKRFASDQARLLDDKELTSLDASLYEYVKRLDLDSATELRNSDEEREKRLIEFLRDQLKRQPNGRRTLVFIPGKTRLHRIASRLHAARSDLLRGTNWEQQLPLNIQTALQRAEDREAAKLIERCAKARIFVHHADIPVDVRRTIELISAEPLASDAPSEVLLATETLSYGVNLAINCVIMLGTMFPSSSRMRELQLAELSSAAFHNMTGRCGRLGKMTPVGAVPPAEQPEANAYIIVTWDLRQLSTNPYRDIVLRYYQGANAVSSQLFLREDKAALPGEEDGLLLEPEAPVLTKFSYPFVRSVLDALGHLNVTTKRADRLMAGPGTSDGTRVPLKDVIKFFNTSLYAHQHRLPGDAPAEQHTHAKAEWGLFEEAVECVLSLCAAPLLSLVSEESAPKPQGRDAPTRVTAGKSGASMYLLTARGRAIIDTGTEIASIEPLLTMVGRIHGIWCRLFGNRPIQTDLYLLALVALVEIRRQNIGATPEFQGRQWTSPLINSNRESVSQMFGHALTRILGKPDLRLKDELYKMLLADDTVRELSTSYPESGVDALLRCFSSVIAWINGRPQPEAVELLEGPSAYSDEGYRVSWKQFTEQLSWKALFLAKLLGTAEPTAATDNTPDVQRDLLLLVSRLRRGCTVEAIPLFWDRDVRIDRLDVDWLKAQGLTPVHILSSSMKWPDSETTKKRPLLLSSLMEYVDNEHRLLATEMNDPSMGNHRGRQQMLAYWNALSSETPSLYRRAIDNFHTNQGPPIGFSQLLHNSLKFDMIPNDTLPHEDSGREAERDLQMSASPLAVLPGIRWLWKWPRRDAPYSADMSFIGLELNHQWEASIESQYWVPLASVLQEMRGISNLILVVVPWLPALSGMPSNVKDEFKQRQQRQGRTTVMTAESLGVMASAVARGLTSSNELTMRLLLNDPLPEQASGATVPFGPCGVDGLFQFIGVQEILRILSRKHLPGSIYERLIQQFEVRPEI